MFDVTKTTLLIFVHETKTETIINNYKKKSNFALLTNLNMYLTYRFKNCYSFLLIILLLRVTLPASATILNTKNGLPSSLINDIKQTSDGYVWIATEDGLTRYDGAKCETYYHVADDSTSLASNYLAFASNRKIIIYIYVDCTASCNTTKSTTISATYVWCCLMALLWRHSSLALYNSVRAIFT